MPVLLYPDARKSTVFRAFSTTFPLFGLANGCLARGELPPLSPDSTPANKYFSDGRLGRSAKRTSRQPSRGDEGSRAPVTGPFWLPATRELVFRRGVKGFRGRAHLTSLRERRRSPEGNLRRLVPQNSHGSQGHSSEVCDGPWSWLGRAKCVTERLPARRRFRNRKARASWQTARDTRLDRSASLICRRPAAHPVAREQRKHRWARVRSNGSLSALGTSASRGPTSCASDPPPLSIFTTAFYPLATCNGRRTHSKHC